MATGLTSSITNRQHLVTTLTPNRAQNNGSKIATELGKSLKNAKNSDVQLKNRTAHNLDSNKTVALKTITIGTPSSEHSLIRSLKNISRYSIAETPADKASKVSESVTHKSRDAQQQPGIAKQSSHRRQPALLSELQNARDQLPDLAKQFFDTRQALDQLIYADNHTEFETISQLKQNLAYHHYQLRDCERTIFSIKQQLQLPPKHSDIEEKLKREERDTPANILNEYRQDISVSHQEERHKLSKLDKDITEVINSKVMEATNNLHLPSDQAAPLTKNQILKIVQKLVQLLEYQEQVVACKAHIYNLSMKERALASNTQYLTIPSRQIADLDNAINETKKTSYALQVYQSKLAS